MLELDRLIPVEAIKRECVSGFLADDMISFNIQRKDEPHTARPVTLLPYAGRQRPIVPGLKNDITDRQLKQSLQEMYTWEEAKNRGFKRNNHFYSFLWRFRRSDPFVRENIRDPRILEERSNREIKRAFRDYRRHLQDNLVPGNIFLLPDVEIDFQNPCRNTKPYARRVLILDTYPDRLLFIPFSTQLHLMNRERDIYFDASWRGKPLASDGRPAVENLDYSRFSRKVFLCIAAAQSFPIADFLDAVLEFVCAVRRDVLVVARERLKKIGPILFQ